MASRSTTRPSAEQKSKAIVIRSALLCTALISLGCLAEKAFGQQFVPQAEPSIGVVTPQPGFQNQPSINPPTPHSDDTLELSPLPSPDLPPPPPAIADPEIPAAFIGCWEGRPDGFDSIATTGGIKDIGTPGKITFCFDGHSIRVPAVEIEITPKARALDLVMHFGLGHDEFVAHGVQTDVSSVTSDRIHSRTNLVVVRSFYWFHLFPTEENQYGQEDEIATLKAPDSLLMQGRLVPSVGPMKMWGTWHAFFRRTSEVPST